MKKLQKHGNGVEAGAPRPKAKQHAEKRATPPKAEAPRRALASPGRAAARTEELRIKVTPETKKQFKQAAKTQALKKGELLEQLLTAWQKAQPTG